MNIPDLATMTEEQLRELNMPWPKTKEELDEMISTLVERQHDYGTAVYAMSLSAIAAYHYVANQLGVSGFQASCADLDFIRRARCLKGPFRFHSYEQALYPQYEQDYRNEVIHQSVADWLKKEGQRLVEETPDQDNHPNPRFIAHIKLLAEGKLPFGMTIKQKAA